MRVPVGKAVVRSGGRSHRGIFVAVWIDAVYFGPRTLSDSVAAHLLVIGLYASTPGLPEAISLIRADRDLLFVRRT
jgi:hypothetical protein